MVLVPRDIKELYRFSMPILITLLRFVRDFALAPDTFTSVQLPLASMDPVPKSCAASTSTSNKP